MAMLNEVLLRACCRWHEMLGRLRDENGQTLAEYGLIITIIAVGATTMAIMVFRDTLASSFVGVTNCLTGASC